MTEIEKRLGNYKNEAEEYFIKAIDNVINNVLKLLKFIDFIETQTKKYSIKTNTTDFVSIHKKYYSVYLVTVQSQTYNFTLMNFLRI